MGVITEKFIGENNYIGLRVEDGSGVILVKGWDGRLEKFQNWENIEILGQIQISELNEEEIEVFINPDIIQSIIDDNWNIVHRLKILQQHKATPIDVKPATVGGLEIGIASIEDLKNKLKDIVVSLDSGEGVTYNQLVKSFPNIDEVQIDEAISELLESGDFFEPKAGIYSSAFE
jgi:uncharacterized protein (DUF433 family)